MLGPFPLILHETFVSRKLLLLPELLSKASSSEQKRETP